MKRVRAVPPSSAKPSVREPAEAERQAVPILSIAQAQKQFMAGAGASSYMLFINAENKRLQVVHRLTTGGLTVIEPYAEDSRLRSSVR
jgi:hypothetical protein